MQTGPDGAGWDAEDGADIGGIHVFDDRKLENAAEFLRKGVDFLAEPVEEDALVGAGRSVECVGCFGVVPRRVAGELAAHAALSIEREPKSDAIDPGAKFGGFAQQVEFLVGAKEGFLGDFLGVGCISEDAVGDVEDAALIFGDAEAKRRLPAIRLYIRLRSRDQSVRPCLRPEGRRATCECSHAATPGTERQR